jgi:C1A family cysteine protease
MPPETLTSDHLTGLSISEGPSGDDAGGPFAYHLASEAEIEWLEMTAIEASYSAPSSNSGKRSTGLSVPSHEYWESLIGRLKIAETTSPSSAPLPSSVDLSSEPYFPKVGDQGMQGSCAAWAVTYYAYGYLEAKDQGWADAKIGIPQHLMSPSWTYNKVNNNSDDGSWPYDNAEVIGLLGCVSLSTMPYHADDPYAWGDSIAWREAPLHKAKDYYAVSFNATTTVPAIKELLAQGIPVVYCLDAWGLDPWGYFSDGNYVISALDYDGMGMDHAQCIVGYDDSVGDDGDVGAFKVVNSWGLGSGDKGYYWITFDAFNEIGNYTYVTYLTDEPDYVPSMVATIQSEGIARNLSMCVGIGDPEDNDSITLEFPTLSGPASPGSEEANEAELYAPSFMCMDISKFTGLYQSGEHGFYLNMSNPGATQGNITGFRVEAYQGDYLPGHPTTVSGEMEPQRAVIPSGGYGSVTNEFGPYPALGVDEALDQSNMTLSSGGSCAWTGEDQVALTHGYAARSGVVEDGARSGMGTELHGPGLLSFYWRISSEAWSSFEDTGDHLRLYLGGSCVADLNGTQDWQECDLALGVGPQQVEWAYEKDASGTMGSDAGWVDAVMFTEGAMIEDQGFDSPSLLSWSATDLNPDSGDDHWGETSFRPVPLEDGGSGCLWCAQVGINYVNGLTNSENHYYDTGMEAVYSTYLAGVGSYYEIWMDFDYYSATYAQEDHLGVEVGSRGEWKEIWAQPATNSQVWSHVHLPIPTEGDAVRFLFHSQNYSLWFQNGDGAYLDNIMILGYVSVANPALSPPSAPNGLITTAGFENVTLKWNEPDFSNASGIVSYRVAYGDSASALDEWIGTTELSLTIIQLTKGRTYFFEVAAQNSAGWGPNSSIVSAIPLGLPDAPYGLDGSPESDQVTLSWWPPLGTGGSPITGYAIYRGPTADELAPLGDCIGTSYIDDMVAPGSTYYYRVGAVNILGEGGQSDSIQILVPLPILSGEFVDVDGHGLAGITVALEDGASVVTDGQGQFAIAASPGNHTLTASGPGIAAQTFFVVVDNSSMWLGTITAQGGSDGEVDILLYVGIVALAALVLAGVVATIIRSKK